MNLFQQSILYRPYIEHNLKLDKKFLKRKKHIFQPSKLKSKRNKTIQSKEHAVQKQSRSKQKLELPDIYLHSKANQKEMIRIEQKSRIMKEISRSLNFINNKLTIINTDLFNLIKQPTKPIPYETDHYKNELLLLNGIFSHCGITLAPRDVLILQGQHSQTKYSLFTNYPKHPQSLCCSFTITIKHMDFVSQKTFKSFDANRSAGRDCVNQVITVSCLKCGRDVIRILPNYKQQTGQKKAVKRSDFEQEKRMINMSKLISSGRFKKLLINDQSIDLIEHPNFSILSRSKTSLKKINQISRSLRLDDKHSSNAEQRYKRQNRIKSQQTTLELKPINGINNFENLIKLRENLHVNNV